jgi:AraC-like DNA-binding protein
MNRYGSERLALDTCASQLPELTAHTPAETRRSPETTTKPGPLSSPFAASRATFVCVLPRAVAPRADDWYQTAALMQRRAQSAQHRPGTQSGSSAPEQAPLVHGERLDPPDGVGDGQHHHAEGQLTWASRGVQRVVTERGTWVTPPSLAVWIPGGALHDSAKWGPGTLHRLKTSATLSDQFPRRCCAVRVSPRLRLTISSATRAGSLGGSSPAARQALDVLALEIQDAAVAPLQVLLDVPPHLAPLLQLLLHSPADARSPSYWARFTCSSPRTFARSFQRDVGMSFREWRQQLRLLHALHALAEGKAVSEVARQLGYKSLSMFTQAFSRRLEASPSRYFER